MTPPSGCANSNAAGGRTPGSGQTLADLAPTINAAIGGWIGPDGGFRILALVGVFRHCNDQLLRWAMREPQAAAPQLPAGVAVPAGVARRGPGLFAHWELVRPSGR
jgi:hypothetical protein